MQTGPGNTQTASVSSWEKFSPNSAVSIAAAPVPTGAKSVSVYNQTAAVIIFKITGWGEFIMPPYTTYACNIPDFRMSFTDDAPADYSVTSIAGDSGAASKDNTPVDPGIYINWTTFT